MTDSKQKAFGELMPLAEGQAAGLTRAERAESAKTSILLNDLEKNFHHLFFPEGAPKRDNH
jgi:hypothetical protein